MRVADDVVCDRCPRCRSAQLRKTGAGYTCKSNGHKFTQPAHASKYGNVRTLDAALVAQPVVVGRGTTRW